MRLYDRSLTEVGAKASADRSQALLELRLALPYASIAAGNDGLWQPLQATLGESNRVPESDLVTALQQQCAGVPTSS